MPRTPYPPGKRQHVHLVGQTPFDREHGFAACGIIKSVETVDLDQASRITCGHCQRRAREEALAPRGSQDAGATGAPSS